MFWPSLMYVSSAITQDYIAYDHNTCPFSILRMGHFTNASHSDPILLKRTRKTGGRLLAQPTAMFERGIRTERIKPLSPTSTLTWT